MLPFISRGPETPEEWARFHWNHFQEHTAILKKIEAETGLTLYMTPIWPVPGNLFGAQIAKWHQDLHNQMNAVDGVAGNDMSQADLRSAEGAQAFINQNYREHLIFHSALDFSG